MIRPLENQDHTHSGEYINRVKQTDPGHGPAARDFAYTIEEVNRDRHKRHQPGAGFGEDTYEAADEKEPEQSQPPEIRKNEDESSTDDHNLDVTV